MKRKESDLCEALMVKARAEGWIVYPETAGFDLILEASPEVFDRQRWRFDHFVYAIENGTLAADFTIGVEAKLQAGTKVLSQATKRGFANRNSTGPRFRQVLVPKAPRHFTDVARQLRVGVWTTRDLRRSGPPLLPVFAHQWIGKKPWLPPVTPEGDAGVPSPRPLTKWRVAALRICNRIEDRGFVTTKDFNEIGITATTWVQSGWIVADGKVGRRNRYVKPDPAPDCYPSHGFEVEAEKLRQFDRSA